MSRLGGDLRLERGNPFGEPRLTSGPHLRIEFFGNGCCVGVDVGHLRNRPLGNHHQLARGRCCSRCKGSGGGHQLGIVDASMGQSEPLSLGTVEHLGEHHRRHRCLRTDDSALHPRVTSTGMQTDLQEAGIELGSAGCNPHIATERKVHSGSDRRPIHRGNRWKARAGNS